MISAKVLADSRTRAGRRLTTLEVVIPRLILAEFNTHRDFSRNSASSRAIPVQKQIDRVMEYPFVPAKFPINKPGMSADEYLEPGDQGFEKVRHAWLDARTLAVKQAEILLGKNVHKQIASRLLEPFMYHTVIVSSTEWENFFALRLHPTAQPEIQEVARAMAIALAASVPRELARHEWHLPFIIDEERDAPLLDQILMSIGRCARVSYLTHDGVRAPQKDIDLARSLQGNGHWSPWEHVAHPSLNSMDWANFKGWKQARRYVEHGGELVLPTGSLR